MSKEVHRNIIDDGFTVFDNSSGTSEHFHKNILTDEFSGDRGTTIYKNTLTDRYYIDHVPLDSQGDPQAQKLVYGLIAALGVLGVLITCVALVWGAGDLSLPAALVALAIALVVWRIVINKNNYRLVDKVFSCISDMIFAAASTMVFWASGYDMGGNFFVWFSMCLLGLFLFLYMPKLQTIGRHRSMGRFFRLLLCWLSPMFMLINEAELIMDFDRNRIHAVTLIVIYILCFSPSIISILKMIFRNAKGND